MGMPQSEAVCVSQRAGAYFRRNGRPPARAKVYAGYVQFGESIMLSASHCKLPAAFSSLSLVGAVFLTASAFAQAPSAAPAAQAATQASPDTAKLTALARQVLEAGFKASSLQGDDVKPWHLKAEYQMLEFGVEKPIPGTFEEWYTGPFQWKRVYTSPEAKFTGAEWDASRTARYHAKPKTEDGFDASTLHLRIARPVVAPLYQAAYIKPEYDLDIKRGTSGGVVLTCVAVAHPERYANPGNPEFILPSMCFDPDMHLRMISAGDATIYFDDFQIFQNRAVAKSVKILVNGQLNAAIKVTLLEPLAPSDAKVVTPPSNAVAEPYTIEPGLPTPESVFEVGASIPIPPGGFPFRGSVSIPVILQKDGSVKLAQRSPDWTRQDVVDAVKSAVVKWKYKPYLLDGQPIEVGFSILYFVDGKPFVPSYNRPKAAATP
jgi:hypothetical protein